MTETTIVAITMPKWGLSMLEGKVMEWLVEEGTELKLGDPVMDIETEKIANTFEALDPGLFRRKVAEPDDVLPIGALLGVIADASVSDEEIEAFIQDFQASYVPPEPEEEEEGDGYLFADVDGYRLRYSKMGDGTAVTLLIHGFGGDADRWLFTQQPLSEKSTVYAFDLPGHGQSTKAVTDGTVSALANVVLAFMDSVQIDTAQLVGHSLGGAIAMEVASKSPNRVTGLGLIAPAGLGPEINTEYIQGFVEADSRKTMKPLLQQLVADPELVNRSLINDMLQYKRIDGVPEALNTIANGFVREGTQVVDCKSGLPDLNMPIKVIWGSEDKIIPASHCEGLPASVETHVLDGFGHLVQLEAASDVNALLKDS